MHAHSRPVCWVKELRAASIADTTHSGGEARMKFRWMAAIVMIGAVSMVGCVSQSKYEEAMGDVDSAKSELALARTQKNALEQQVRTLKDLNVKFGSEAQLPGMNLNVFSMVVTRNAAVSKIEPRNSKRIRASSLLRIGRCVMSMRM